MSRPRTKRNSPDLPPKACPACGRTLPRSMFYGAGGKCKPCYRAHRVAKGTDSTTLSRTQKERRATAAEQLRADPVSDRERTGVDFRELAQRELFGDRPYTALDRAECGAVRRRALELFAAPEAKSA